MMSVAMYSHMPHKFSLIQAMAGVQMWRCGASNKASDCIVCTALVYE